LHRSTYDLSHSFYLTIIIMRSSTVFALVALAVTSPSLAAPVTSYLKRQDSATADSGALDYAAIGDAVENFGDVLKIVSEGKEAIEGLVGKQRRQDVWVKYRYVNFVKLIIYLCSSDPASGAVNWGTVISDGIKVFDGVTGGLTLASAIKEHLDNNQQRDFIELLARQST
jgi:hypothetical protein